MVTILETLLAFIIVFGILVFIHEFGHFFAAKLVGIRVEVFSFGYGKRLFGFKKGSTDYRLSLIPMGGYVRFLGEGMFDPGRKLEPDDFMAKNRLQRFLVIGMGSMMNILLAVVILAAINMVGVTVPEYQEQKPNIGWIEPESPASRTDLWIGDEILSINNKKVKTWSDVELAVGTKPEKRIVLEVKRDGQILRIPLLTEKRTKYDMGYAGFFGRILTQVLMVTANSPAEKGGLKPGDVIQAINGEPVYYYRFIEIIESNPEHELEFLIEREGKPLTLHITPRREGKVGKIGILQSAKSISRKYGFFAAVHQSFKDNARMIFLVIDFLKNVFTGQVSTRQIGGPLEIAKFSYAAFRMGFVALMLWIAVISLQLGVINLFPIPVFDGGQIFVLMLEGIFRRDFNPKARQIWMQIGFVIFIFLIVFILLNDFVKRLPNGWEGLLPF
ncbi:MAG: RIP metalloprotease RseP [Candidatus Aminicenantales bacterium]